MNTYTSHSTLCCHWCKIPLGNASQVTYLNGNLPICDLCLGTAQAQILSAFAEKDKRIAELEAQVNDLKAFAIWMTGCGYDFTQHQYFIDQRDKLFKSDNQTKEEREK